MQRSAALESYLKRRKEEKEKEIVIVPRTIKTVSSLLEKRSVSFSCLPSWCTELRVYPSESIVLWFRAKSDNDQSASSCKLLTNDQKIRQIISKSTDKLCISSYWLCDSKIFCNPFIANDDIVFNISILRASQGIFSVPEYFLPSFIPWKTRCDQTWSSDKYAAIDHIKFDENEVTMEYKTAQKVQLRQMQKENDSAHPENDYMVSMFELRIG